MVAACCLVVLSFCVNGAHGMIGGAASMDFGGRKAAATAAGLFDGMQYLAGAFVGLGVGYITTTWGWGPWHWAPIPFALVGALLMLRIWNVRAEGKGEGIEAARATDLRLGPVGTRRPGPASRP